ncbi:hypothetical protein GGI22_006879, partial [Coemansia erecta]
MITLDSLVSEYSQDVDKKLIAAIWTEHAEDQPRCCAIIHMLSGRGEAKRGSMASLVDYSESCSLGSLDSQSLESPLFSTTTTSITSCDVNSQRSAGDLPSGNKVADRGSSIEAITSATALVDFLVACFPECGADYLATKVDEIFATQDKSEFQVDPVEAIDIISNAYYNDMEAVENQKYHRKRTTSAVAKSTQTNSSLLIDDIAAKYKVSSGANKKGKKKKTSSGNRTRHNGSSVATMGNDSLSQNAGNAWNIIDKELNSICSIFPNVSIRTVKSVYHECGANVDKTVEKLADTSYFQTKPKGCGKESGPALSFAQATPQERQK